jgi:hypothetical protein
LLGLPAPGLADPSLVGCYSHVGPNETPTAEISSGGARYVIRLMDGDSFDLEIADRSDLQSIEEDLEARGIAASLTHGLKYDELIVAIARDPIADPQGEGRTGSRFIIVNPESGAFVFHRVPCS